MPGIGVQLCFFKSDGRQGGKTLKCRNILLFKSFLPFNMGKTDTQIVDVSGLGMYLLPGSHMTITAAAESGTGHDVTIATNWRELL